MIDILNLSIQFSGTSLFEEVNLKINRFDKISLVGANGSGKSTLLKLLMGYEQPETGNITKQKGIKIKYLPQEFLSKSNFPLFKEVKSALPNQSEIAEKEEFINAELLDPDLTTEQQQELIEELGEIHLLKENLDYYSLDSRIEKVLIGLGFCEKDFEKPVDTFSGGWQMRIELAKILLSDPDLIMLDEPTNHLDIDSLQWLIDFLKSFKGSLIVVSHDKYFVNCVTNKTLEIFNRKLSFFNGNYDAYIKFKEERDDNLNSQFKNQQKQIAALERFIDRFRYKASKAKQVQSRIKMLEKFDQVDLPEFIEKIHFRFPEVQQSGVVPMELNNIGKRFETNQVLKNINFKIERGEKIAFLGPNGAGKTTLAKIIAGKSEPTEGELIVGYNTSISYYAQEVTAELDLEKDILDTLSECGEEYSPAQLRSLAGSFLFSDDDVFKKVSVLSGGEKSRVALAKLLLTKANLVVLDEPTNHLDVTSKEVLQSALINFTGTLIIVSHDIDFIRPIVNKVVEIRDGQFKVYSGDIDYYLRKRKELLELDNNFAVPEKDDDKKNNRKETKRIEAELRQKRYKATKDIIAKIQNTENDISVNEEKKANLEYELSLPDIYSNPTLIKQKRNEYETVNKTLEMLYLNWTEFSEKLEEIEKAIQ
ncbi:MAG TPA: ATP-binding cassette domain-containing protein [Melioribacteraceae bacterium]|nr:ATP-binding cassette domain-containing protein [Melioribacteraceae bacterium]